MIIFYCKNCYDYNPIEDGAQVNQCSHCPNHTPLSYVRFTSDEWNQYKSLLDDYGIRYLLKVVENDLSEREVQE